jgi:hypothetical protein
MAYRKRAVEKSPPIVRAAACLVWMGAMLPGYYTAGLLLDLLRTYVFRQEASYGLIQGYALADYAFLSVLTGIFTFCGYAVWIGNGRALSLMIGLYLLLSFGVLLPEAVSGGDMIYSIAALYCIITLATLVLAFPQRTKKPSAH